MAKVLVTGGTGFLGSNLVHALVSNEFEVIILKRSTSDIWRIEDIIDDVLCYDIDKHGIERAFEKNKIDIAIHTACSYGRNNESISEIVDSNIKFGLQVIESCIKYKVGAFFNTDTLLPEHINPYTKSKKHFVDWLKLLSVKIQIVNLKLEHMYGPGDGNTKFVSWVIKQLFDEVEEIKLTKGNQKRDFIFIDDVVTAYLTVIKNRGQFENYSEFEVGTGNAITIRSFVKRIKDVYEKEIGNTFTEFNFGAIPYRESEMMNIKVENQGLLDLGWIPLFTQKKGLKKMMKKYEN